MIYLSFRRLSSYAVPLRNCFVKKNIFSTPLSLFSAPLFFLSQKKTRRETTTQTMGDYKKQKKLVTSITSCFFSIIGPCSTEELCIELNELFVMIFRDECKAFVLSIVDIDLDENALVVLTKIMIHPNSRISMLCLLNNNLTELDLCYLAKIIEHPDNKLTWLELKRNQLVNNNGLIKLYTSLRNQHCKVNKLTCHSSRVDANTMLGLSETLVHPYNKLTDLTLENIQFNDTTCLIDLYKSLRHEHCKVTCLRLAESNIGNETMLELSETLKHPTCRLTNLSFYTNNITEVGMDILNDAFKTPYTKLERLDLTGNPIELNMNSKLYKDIIFFYKLISLELSINVNIHYHILKKMNDIRDICLKIIRFVWGLSTKNVKCNIRRLPVELIRKVREFLY